MSQITEAYQRTKAQVDNNTEGLSIKDLCKRNGLAYGNYYRLKAREEAGHTLKEAPPRTPLSKSQFIAVLDAPPEPAPAPTSKASSAGSKATIVIMRNVDRSDLGSVLKEALH